MVIFPPVFINGLRIVLQVVFSCAFHGICAIIISMNEEGNGATAPQVQNQAPVQPVKPTSAVNAGFDASKLGSGKKHKPEKVKKVKEKKDKETKKINQSSQNGLRERTKRPLWFWIVLSVLAVAVVGVGIWAIATLFVGTGDEGGIPTELALKDEPNDDNSSLTQQYIEQLRAISRADETNKASEQQAEGLANAKSAVQKALQTPVGQSQQNHIRVAEVAVIFQHGQYSEAIEAAKQIDVDALDPDDQYVIYEVLNLSYAELGDSESMYHYLNLAIKVNSEKVKE